MLDLRAANHADRDALISSRTATVAVVVPTRNEAAAIGPIAEQLAELREAGAVDRVLIVDDSSDQTAAIARAAGCDVLAQSSLMSEFGAVRGKGDALWRGLSVIEEEVVCFVDGDTANFDSSMVCALVAAVLDGKSFAKAAYRRPFASPAGVAPTGGGRVTELTAKPLLRRFFPELAEFSQPLAGELAARTEVLKTLPFATGYAVDAALLIDVWRSAGLDAMVEVNTGTRQNRHRPLEELSAMADEVAAAILGRAGVLPGSEPSERPALTALQTRPIPAYLTPWVP